MQELVVFNNEQFGEIRTIENESGVWFVATDVCKALEISNPSAAVDRLDEDERSKFNLGRQGMTNVVNEYGLYGLVLGSRKKEAQEFKRWIKHDVLPSIRKTGGYIAGQESMSDSELMAKALLVAQKQIEERQKRIDSLTQKVELDAPKVLFADAVAASHTSILIGEFAKLLKQNGVDIGRDRLFAWLRENGWLIKDKRRSEFNSPTQKGMNLGLFDVKEGTVINPDGSVRITRTTKITGKGQEFFINLFLRGGFANG